MLKCFSYNPGQKLLGRLCTSRHFTPNSIILTIGCTIWERACSCASPPPYSIFNFWWKPAGILHKGVVKSFKEVSRSEKDYPKWFSQGKTSLILKEGEFLSENQRLITSLNNMYKWFTSNASWHPWTNTLNMMA